MVVDLPIAKVAFGVRYGPHWGIRDTIGSMVDRILRAKGSPFDPGTFPRSRTGDDEHLLFHPDNNDQLLISPRDLLLIKELETQKVQEVEQLSRQFVAYAVEPVRELGKIQMVNRHGFLLQLGDCARKLKRPLTHHYLQEEGTNARDLLLRFTLRYPTDEAHLKPKVNDYKNVIYTLQQNEKGETLISVDYQHYFDPPLDSAEWRDKPFERFVEAGLAYFQGTFAKWLKTLLREEAA